MSTIRQFADQREINYCLGTLSVFGIITARSCCEVDELFAIDQEESNEFPIDSNLFFIDNHICLINKTVSLNTDVQKIDLTNNCSISLFDSSTSYFINKEIDDRNISCSNGLCFIIFDSDENLTLLNGTAIICNHSTIYGIISSSELKCWHHSSEYKIRSFRLDLYKLTPFNFFRSKNQSFLLLLRHQWEWKFETYYIKQNES